MSIFWQYQGDSNSPSHCYKGATRHGTRPWSDTCPKWLCLNEPPGPGEERYDPTVTVGDVRLPQVFLKVIDCHACQCATCILELPEELEYEAKRKVKDIHEAKLESKARDDLYASYKKIHSAEIESEAMKSVVNIMRTKVRLGEVLLRVRTGLVSGMQGVVSGQAKQAGSFFRIIHPLRKQTPEPSRRNSKFSSSGCEEI